MNNPSLDDFSSHSDNPPKLETFMTDLHPIIFLGAGPGDPELITVKGMKALSRADVVLYAGSLVSPAVLTWAPPAADMVDTAPLALEDIVARLIQRPPGRPTGGAGAFRRHQPVTAPWQEQMEILAREDIPWQVIPGVTAAAAAAAALSQELTLPEVTQTVILTRAAGRTPVPERENLRSLAAHGSTLAIYLSVSMIEQVALELAASYGPGAPAVVAYRVSWPDELLIRADAGRYCR